MTRPASPALRGTALALAFALLAAAAPPVAVAIAGPDHGRARVEAAATTYAAAEAMLTSGRATVEDVYRWSLRWLDAQRELPARGKALLDAARAHLARMTALEERTAAAVERGTASPYDLSAARYYRAEAALWVDRKGRR